MEPGLDRVAGTILSIARVRECISERGKRMRISNSVDERSEFLAFLGERGVGGVSHHTHSELFVLGDGDVSFSELSVDSLALMEIGIGLDEQYGLSLTQRTREFLDCWGSLARRFGWAFARLTLETANSEKPVTVSRWFA